MPDLRPTPLSLVNEEIGDGVLAVDANGVMFDLNTEAARCVAAINAMEAAGRLKFRALDIDEDLESLRIIIEDYEEKAVKNA